MATPNIRSFYEGDRSRTEVDGTMPAFQPPSFREPAADPAPRGGPTPAPRSSRRTGGRMSVGGGPRMLPSQKREDPLAMLKAMDQYEMMMRNAAMRPVGLGPQMIPGMAEDPRLLPARLRPQNSSFQNIAGPSDAGITPSAPPQARPDSNAGFDFMPANEQARWLAAYGRNR